MKVVLEKSTTTSLAPLVDHFEELLLELRRCMKKVDLAGERDDVGRIAQLLGVDVEVHAPHPPSDRKAAEGLVDQVLLVPGLVLQVRGVPSAGSCA